MRIEESEAINTEGIQGEIDVGTEWFVSCNPKKYDVINAFTDLKKIDWRQSTNVAVDDIIYIYVSGTYQSLKYKCRTNKVNLPELEIDDRQYDLTGEFDGSYGRYMELELIEGLDGVLFSRSELEKHGFGTPQSPIRVPGQVKEYLDVVQSLLHADEMDPLKHDGCYELMQEIVKAYSKMPDLSQIDYKDLNLVYFSCIGTWTYGFDKKKRDILDSHLPEDEKERLVALLDRIQTNAQARLYENRESDKDTIGMFGTGFKSFLGKADAESSRRFVQICIDALSMDDDSAIFDRCAQVINSDFRGMRAASASIVLHTLKPFTFPILNGNAGNGNVFSYLGINLNKPSEIGTYIQNCRAIKEFRDTNFTVKNYRIYDRAIWKVSQKEDDFWPTNEEYPVGLTAYDWKSFLEEIEYPAHKGCIRVLKCFLDIGGIASPKRLSDEYKGHPMVYTSSVSNTSRRALKYFNMEPCPYQDTQYLFPIAFQGKEGIDDDSGTYIYKMRDELLEALRNMDLEDIELEYKKGTEDMDASGIGLNTILYGPPGTGKTYSTVKYAVSICDPGFAVSHEEYGDFLQRYNELKEEGRIVFTTFHQSYGYEEFIEGIKPVLDSEDTDDEEMARLDYTIENGLFKRFCEKASMPTTENVKDFGFNDDPVVWKVSLSKTFDNPIRTECLQNDHIRIGWSSYGPDLADAGKYDNGGRAILNAFINKMRVGDIVFSCYSQSTIDAVGVITGDYEWDDTFDEYQRVRNVRWILKKNIDIRKMNNGRNMVQSAVYRMTITAGDVVKMLKDELPVTDDIRSQDVENYVFIIDEINRGNISKIFGELITLIEPSKRLGNPEEMKIVLPYSKIPFGVPNNVYILGTMNTADRSIALMDTALRRRFNFVEMMPNIKVIEGITITDNEYTLEVDKMLDTINERIEYLFDREHTIGHAFFTGLRLNPTLTCLAEIFRMNVIPLLQEYFYEDYEKIQLVLGDNDKSRNEYKFILDEKADERKIFKGNTDLDIREKKYVVQYDAFDLIQSYIEISETKKAETTSEQTG